MTILHLLVSFLIFGETPVLVPADHDFKLSVCEMVYVPEKQSFDIKFYLFQDDLKAALYNDPNATGINAEAAGDYIIKHFSLRIDGHQQSLKLKSMQEKNDQVLVNFSVPLISTKPPASLLVKNTLLLEKFRDQINMLYLILPENDKKTLMLNATRTEGNFSL